MGYTPLLFSHLIIMCLFVPRYVQAHKLFHMNKTIKGPGAKPQEPEHEKSRFAEMEEEIISLWEETDAFQKSVDMRPEDKQYVFYDGPPFATGLPHYGHMLASTVKDSVPRFWTMRGYRVERRWGWDCHGLPIENLIEKAFDLNSRADIEEYGIDKFNAACKNAIFKYDEEWGKFVKRIGRWVDFENSYKTMDNSYMESVWWAFEQLWEKDLVYKGRRVSLYCPRCETPLSNFEIAMDNSYADVDDRAVIWKFPLKEDTTTSLVAWTTTPWTTPSTVGIAVGPEYTYVKVKVGEENLICVKERLEYVVNHLDEGDWEVVEEIKGADLVGKEYEPILSSYLDLPEAKEHADKVYRVYGEDYVEVTEGTGLVTINGSYGEIDKEAADRNGLPLIIDVDTTGSFNSMGGKYAGKNAREVQEEMIDDVKADGRVWRKEMYRHSYPHCWRCETPLFYYATPAWYVNVQKIKPQMLEANQEIEWTPNHLKDGRFGQGLENAPDWNISRSRFWGTAIPVWECTDKSCDHREVVGSVAQLSEKSGEDKSEMDLHRPYVDEVTWACGQGDCGGTMQRIPEVFDCWVESGSMPFAEKHYPFNNQDAFEQFYPADFISEYINQTRGWFYTLHVLSTALFGKPAFRNAVTSGMIVAEDGAKMSKSKKNYPDPALMFNKYSVDAVRFYLLSSVVMDAGRLRFSEREVDEIQRKYINTVWNVFTFYKMFADKEGYGADNAPAELTDASELTNVLDKWVLSRMEYYTKLITDSYEGYDIRKTAAPLQDMVQEVSTWYLRRSRERFKGEDAADREMAIRVLYTVLMRMAKLGAPVTPFITEKIFQELRTDADQVSVHHCDWPEVNEALVDTDTEEAMEATRKHIEAVLALRQEAKLKVRQPLASATIAGWSTDSNDAEQYGDILMDELNVKAVLTGDNYGIDTELTEELRVEGVLREMVRQTNSFRKKARLSITDTIALKVQTTNEDVKKMLEAHGDEYQRSVLADSVELVEEAQEKKIKLPDGETTVGW